MTPRVLFLAHTAYDLPLSPALARKWDALADVMDVRVVATARRVEASDERFRLLRFPALEGPAFFISLPAVTAVEIRRFRPQVVVSNSAYEGFAALPACVAASARPKLVVEVHGDWRTAARLYGSPGRRIYAPLSDRAAQFALRRADATRAVTGYTASLVRDITGRPPLAVFPAYADYSTFAERPPLPLPAQPVALWVGVLERYKNADGFAEAWRLVAERLPRARLVVVGRGRLRPVVDALARDLPGRVQIIDELSPPEIARRLDAASLLVLPSRSEGMGRVVLEAFLRGRPVVGSDVGGIPDLVHDGRNGLLVPPGSREALTDALVRLLSDRALTERLGTRARADAEALGLSAERFATDMRRLVDRVLS